MKKLIFLFLALCLAGGLALAEEMSKTANEPSVTVIDSSSETIETDNASDSYEPSVDSEKTDDEMEKGATEEAGASK